METILRLEPTNRLLQVAEVEITYSHKVKPSDQPKITNSREASEIFKACIPSGVMDHHEQAWVILLSKANKVLGVIQLSSGGVGGTVADIKIIFQAAIKANASGIIFGHNHPSGNLTASQADLNLTKKLKAAGLIMEIPLVDAMIVTSEKYYSFADEGIL